MPAFFPHNEGRRGNYKVRLAQTIQSHSRNKICLPHELTLKLKLATLTPIAPNLIRQPSAPHSRIYPGAPSLLVFGCEAWVSMGGGVGIAVGFVDSDICGGGCYAARGVRAAVRVVSPSTPSSCTPAIPILSSAVVRGRAAAIVIGLVDMSWRSWLVLGLCLGKMAAEGWGGRWKVEGGRWWCAYRVAVVVS